MAEYADYVWLVRDPRCRAHLDQLAREPAIAPAQQRALRRTFSAEHCRLLVEQVDLRRRAEKKFGALARQFFFTPQLLEQATDIVVSGYKAARFLRVGDCSLVHDFCCGLGGDAALLSTRRPTVAWDMSDIACLLASANLEVMGDQGRVQQADVSGLMPEHHEAWHVDPDRRAGGMRSTTLERHSPPPEVINSWLESSPNGAVKLAPASSPPEAWEQEAELEWITNGRECRQQVVWFGQLATCPGIRRATRLIPEGLGGRVAGSIIGQPDVDCAAAHSPGRFMYDPDPAVLAAKLLGELANNQGLATLGVGGAYLTSDAQISHPLLQSFAVMDLMPLRAAKVAQTLAHRNVGRVEIKKRGVATDPEKFRRELKLHGDNEATVILTRIAKREVALICERLLSPETLNYTPPAS